MTLMETKVVLEDGISVGGKELREIYEVVNHKKAYQYVKKCIAEGKILDEPIVKDIHAILTENIIVGGIYRNQEVRISGAGHVPPVGNGRYLSQKKIGLLQCPGNLCGTRRARRICRFSGRIVRTAVRCLYQTDLKIKILPF